MKSIKLVLLDAGHGGLVKGKYVTAGKRSPVWADGSQYYEGVGNRQIREELAKMLKEACIDYKYVNEFNDDESLTARVRKVNEEAKKHGASNVLLISIHSDAFDKPTAKGWSCYTTKGKTASDTYAEVLYSKMRAEFPNEVFRTDTTDGDQDKEEAFYIIKNTVCPAILSENFFMTNEDECKRILMTQEGRRKIAKAHFEMIKEFYKK